MGKLPSIVALIGTITILVGCGTETTPIINYTKNPQPNTPDKQTSNSIQVTTPTEISITESNPIPAESTSPKSTPEESSSPTARPTISDSQSALPVPTQTPSIIMNVNIQDSTFNPQNIIIDKGTQVTWTNNDSDPHIIKSDIFESKSLNKGQSFSFTFNNAGTFDYFCSIHPSMTGQIIVK